MAKKLTSKECARLLFLEYKNLLVSLFKELDIGKDASPVAIVSAATLAVFRFFPLINKLEKGEKKPQFFKKMFKDYKDLLKKLYLGKDVAIVKTAVPLTTEEEEILSDKIASIFGRYLKLETEVDPDLIGGLVIKIGDKVIDRSISGKLKRLEEHLGTQYA